MSRRDLRFIWDCYIPFCGNTKLTLIVLNWLTIKTVTKSYKIKIFYCDSLKVVHFCSCGPPTNVRKQFTKGWPVEVTHHYCLKYYVVRRYKKRKDGFQIILSLYDGAGAWCSDVKAFLIQGV